MIAGVSHDFCHDGFNNGYHVARQTARFLEHGSDGVQEKYHFAESFKVIERAALLRNLSAEQAGLFRRRMCECILATDMARHMSDLNDLRALVEQQGSSENLLAPGVLDPGERERRRTKLLELTIHASDISNLARPREAQELQVYLLFEEFFNQGDLEAEAGLSVSFLCDRATINVAKSCANFGKFGPIPLFKIIGHFCPSKAYIAGRMEQSAERWEQYAENESEEHRQTYIKREGQAILNQTWV